MTGAALPAYPIASVLAPLAEALGGSPTVILSAPPGSGKSTIVPLALLDGDWLAGRSILMLEPRRLAARACAERMAQLIGEPVGRSVGYRVRLERRVSAATRIEVVTEGILTRRLQADPELSGVGLVIFDEFHERSLQADLGLALCRDVQSGLREDLRLLVMSATLEVERLQRVLDGAPVLSGGALIHPVEIRYLDRDPVDGIAETVARGVLRALDREAGDVLAFLPGEAEIRRAESLLADAARDRDVRLCPLFGNLGQEAQLAALRPRQRGGRRVVLATDIAETSLTIEGVRCVVDGGWARVPRFDPGTALTRLETLRVSRASADQRAGRAGRLGPGVCLRLWSEGRQARLPAREDPEILSADLAGLVLELALWGLSEPAALAWVDPPPLGALAQARDLLRSLDALDAEGRITAQGRRMAGLGLHPRLAHLVLESERRGCLGLGADLAALLSERDLFPRGTARARSVDLGDRLRLLDLWRRGGGGAVRAGDGDAAACARVHKIASQLLSRKDRGSPLACTIGALLAAAYPDRVGRRRDRAGAAYLFVSGGAARLPEDDPLRSAELLVAPSVRARGAEGRIHLAAPIGLEEIRQTLGHQVARFDVVRWDERAGAVDAVSEERLGPLVLERKALRAPDPLAVGRALLEGVRRAGPTALPWTEQARRLQARWLTVRGWQPEESWPDISDQTLMDSLDQWLLPWLGSMSRLDQLRRLDLEQILRSRLDWDRQQALDRLAPERIEVPSGSRKQILYSPGEPPVLAVRLQELFGLAETPRVCAGRVPLLLHLLSPAQRPIQVTQDLAGFWHRTYPEVKKELKGRYPKHYWPDDPWSAVPTAAARPRPAR
jgi:ATP-dependent helicase HrpB